VAVHVAAAGGGCTTLVDPNQLENALLNLCINARDAMPDGGRITIETALRGIEPAAARELDLAAGEYVALMVRDTGSGMPPEVIARAFDPFFTTKPLGEGTGLGLSMVYGFVRQSGGQARITSQPGQGTEICLLLPRFFGDAEELAQAPQFADAKRAEANEAVLVVDDEPSIRMLIAEVLEELGYKPVEASDGKAALKILETPRRLDLLITDVGLPGGMNGRQLADAALLLRPELKVLFITGYAEQSVIADARQRPGVHVVTKPFAMEALANRIKEIISGK
jgi:CheY-like chemotaxis protein